MKIYVVLGYDRHTDVVCEVYDNEETAKKRFLEYCARYSEGISPCETYCYCYGNLYAELREGNLNGEVL